MDGSNFLTRPHPLTVRQLADQITELTGHLNAATYTWLMLVAEFDRRKGWNDGGTQTCAHWLNWQCGINIGAAREKVRVAHALAKVPKIAAAMERGQLSYSKVRALTRIATAENEDFLLMLALHGTANHVENVVRYYRRCKEAEELSREARQHANRSVSLMWDPEDGSLLVKARLPAETGRLFMNALERVVDAMPESRIPANVSAETLANRTPITMRRADALAVVAESFLKHGPEDMTGGQKNEIVVHVEVGTLRDSTHGRCELENGPSLAAETARRLACDASTYTVYEDGKGEPLNIGRKSRTIPAAIRRALNARDRGCRFPGCPNKRFVDGHHIKHWINGGETSLKNLVTLCRFHHRQVHEGLVFVQRLEDGTFRFLKPNGQLFGAPSQFHADAAGVEHVIAQHEKERVNIDEHTACTHWRGEVIDYSTSVAALFGMDQRSRVSANGMVRPASQLG